MYYTNDRFPTTPGDVAAICEDAAEAIVEAGATAKDNAHAYALAAAAVSLRSAEDVRPAALTVARVVAAALCDDAVPGTILTTAWAYAASLAEIPSGVEPEAWLSK